MFTFLSPCSIYALRLVIPHLLAILLAYTHKACYKNDAQYLHQHNITNMDYLGGRGDRCLPIRLFHIELSQTFNLKWPLDKEGFAIVEALGEYADHEVQVSG